MSDAQRRVVAACVQVNAGEDMAQNLATAAGFVRDACRQGARLVALPENVAMMTWGSRNIRGNAQREEDHAALAGFRELARETQAWLLLGSLTVALPDEPDGRVANRSYLLAPDGRIAARYDKIHMFDVDLASGESYRESKNFRPGGEAVVADTPFGALGMTVCYDVRFPYLYRTLAQRGADLLAVPSAFTRVTGAAHWHVLLRARAIESGCYVLAPAQCGTHPGPRETYGHSLIVDPWGQVLADGGEAPGVVLATLDLAEVARARGMVPALRHDRPIATADAPLRRAV